MPENANAAGGAANGSNGSSSALRIEVTEAITVPVINRNGELVGLNFDSNIQKLPNRYWYVEVSEGGRAVGVHSAGIIEAMRKLYGADKLVKEVLGQ